MASRKEFVSNAVIATALATLALLATFMVVEEEHFQEGAPSGFDPQFPALSTAKLDEKKRGYTQAAETAVKLKAEFELAKKRAVEKKEEFDSFQREHNVEKKAYVHKMAAYMEVKKAAKEAHQAQSKELKAEESRKAYLAAKKAMEEQAMEAKQYRNKAAKDQKAAMEEVREAAKGGFSVGGQAKSTLRNIDSSEEVESRGGRDGMASEDAPNMSGVAPRVPRPPAPSIEQDSPSHRYEPWKDADRQFKKLEASGTLSSHHRGHSSEGKKIVGHSSEGKKIAEATIAKIFSSATEDTTE